MCLWLTEPILKKLALGPAWLVEILLSDTETWSPCNDQLMLIHKTVRNLNSNFSWNYAYLGNNFENNYHFESSWNGKSCTLNGIWKSDNVKKAISAATKSENWKLEIYVDFLEFYVILSTFNRPSYDNVIYDFCITR